MTTKRSDEAQERHERWTNRETKGCEFADLRLAKRLGIRATEATAPKGRRRIEWKLLTNLPVDSLDAAIEKLKWYALRWKIETFHKI